MFCSNCGAAVADGVTTCPSCGAAVGPPASGPAAATSPAGAGAKVYLDYAKATGHQAFAALRQLAGNPVGSFQQAYESLGDKGALRVGIAFGVVSVACFLLGGYLMIPEFIRDGFFEVLGFGGFMKLLFFAFTPFLCTAACSIGVRNALGAGGGIGGDCFIVGTALLPASIWALLSGILGYTNFRIVAVLLVFAMCIGVLVLFAGYTRVSRVSERAATFAVPAVIVVSMWLASMLMEPVVSGSISAPRAPRGMPTPPQFPF